MPESSSYDLCARRGSLRLDDTVVAFVCDDQLFLKPTEEGRRFLGEVMLAPPYPGAKDYFLIVAELDEPERLHGSLEVTAQALPPPRPKGGSRRAQKDRAVPVLKARPVAKRKAREPTT